MGRYILGTLVICIEYTFQNGFYCNDRPPIKPKDDKLVVQPVVRRASRSFEGNIFGGAFDLYVNCGINRVGAA